MAEQLYSRYLDMIQTKLGSGVTYADQLENLSDNLLGSKFRGVFSSDQIPQLNDLVPYAILNLDRSNQPGSHWIAVSKDNNGILVYDSFGRKTHKIIPSISQSGNGFVRQTDEDREQHPNEENCGQRCIAWLMVHKNHGAEMARQI